MKSIRLIIEVNNWSHWSYSWY